MQHPGEVTIYICIPVSVDENENNYSTERKNIYIKN